MFLKTGSKTVEVSLRLTGGEVNGQKYAYWDDTQGETTLLAAEPVVRFCQSPYAGFPQEPFQMDAQ